MCKSIKKGIDHFVVDPLKKFKNFQDDFALCLQAAGELQRKKKSFGEIYFFEN